MPDTSAANKSNIHEVFNQLQPGDRIELEHEVKVGFQLWTTKIAAEVVRKERRRQGLHTQRNPDDKVFTDMIVLRKEDGELTTVSLDDFSSLKKL